MVDADLGLDVPVALLEAKGSNSPLTCRKLVSESFLWRGQSRSTHAVVKLLSVIPILTVDGPMVHLRIRSTSQRF